MNISNVDEKDASVVAKKLNFDWTYWLKSKPYANQVCDEIEIESSR